MVNGIFGWTYSPNTKRLFASLQARISTRSWWWVWTDLQSNTADTSPIAPTYLVARNEKARGRLGSGGQIGHSTVIIIWESYVRKKEKEPFKHAHLNIQNTFKSSKIWKLTYTRLTSFPIIFNDVKIRQHVSGSFFVRLKKQQHYHLDLDLSTTIVWHLFGCSHFSSNRHIPILFTFSQTKSKLQVFI